MLYRIDAAPKVAVIVQPKSFAIKLLSNADIILYRALVGIDSGGGFVDFLPKIVPLH
jgi:hypothetical protein